MRFRALLLFLSLGLLLGSNYQINHAQTGTPPVATQSNEGQISADIHTSVDYSFGETIHFTAVFKPQSPIANAVLFYHSTGDARTYLGDAEITMADDSSISLSYTHSLAERQLRVFTQVEYHFEIYFESGEVLTSQPEFFEYTDNRWEWRVLEEKPFRVHWVSGNLPFAQSVLDAAQSGLQRAQNLIPVASPKVLDIYAYSDFEKLQAVLTPNSASWVAGHADPDLGIIVAALPDGPEQPLLIEQRIPHELMHVLLYQYTREGYSNLPTWLTEGLASMVEMFPNPDYRVLLEHAAGNGTLLPMTSLCGAFPRDASAAFLSYAQAASFTQFLYSQFGNPSLEKLIQSYTSGVDCGRGVEIAFGSSLVQLDRQWQQEELQENVTRLALKNLLPWLVLMAAILVLPAVVLFASRKKQ